MRGRRLGPRNAGEESQRVYRASWKMTPSVYRAPL
jgi:hypothetical protein